MDPVDAVQQCGGAARWDRLQHLTTHRALDATVRTGGLRRPATGFYVAPGAPPDVVAAVAVRGVRSCHCAAEAWGLDLVEAPTVPHVTAPRGSRLTWGRTVVHRRSAVDLDGCTDVLSTCLDCLGCLPRRFALVPVDSALRQGRITLEDLVLARKRMRRNDPRRTLIPLADPESGSALETVARVDLHDEGYRVESQQVREPAGRVDFVIDGWLVVEVDGHRFHAGLAQFTEDRRRDAELTAQGLVVLRFTYEQVLRRRDWYLGMVRDTYRRGPQGRR